MKRHTNIKNSHRKSKIVVKLKSNNVAIFLCNKYETTMGTLSHAFRSRKASSASDDDFDALSSP